eukprot:TRINITY_DN8885_c0_g1_i1.p1 TRINITY_DN8885_c0_g1~~TRINITY_DN8885_c0_g1_i1.p1  ORF type:complete len:187 (+),score=21.62 TRINITY_DN8885_c0_g1_i1:68-628(+)
MVRPQPLRTLKKPPGKAKVTTIPPGRVKTRMRMETSRLNMGGAVSTFITAALEDYIKTLADEAKKLCPEGQSKFGVEELTRVINKEEGKNAFLITNSEKPSLPYALFKRLVHEQSTNGNRRFTKAAIHNMQKIAEKTLLNLLVDAKTVKPSGSLNFKAIQVAHALSRSKLTTGFDNATNLSNSSPK